MYSRVIPGITPSSNFYILIGKKNAYIKIDVSFSTEFS